MRYPTLAQREAEIIAVGEKLATQLRGVFVVDSRKLRDFRARATLSRSSEHE